MSRWARSLRRSNNADSEVNLLPQARAVDHEVSFEGWCDFLHDLLATVATINRRAFSENLRTSRRSVVIHYPATRRARAAQRSGWENSLRRTTLD